ncbi:MAG: CehA/McbA family metallohydrolase, partial [Acidobacteriota bacterium]
PFRWWWGPWGGQAGYPFAEKTRVSNMAVELPLDTLLGPTYDGIDLLTTAGEEESNQKAFHLWRMLLNRGYRVAATASSDSTFDRPGGGRPGSVRTYTYLNEPFSLGAVARATALGRTFVTSGPLIVASLEGFPPGSSTAADGTNRKLRIEAWASGSDSVGLSELELYRNGEVIERRRFDPPVFDLEVSREVTETESAWYCIRVRGGEQGLQQAITGAFFLDPSEFHPPEPVPVRVAVNISDRETGQPLEGTAHEIRFLGPVSRKEGSHLVPKQGALLEIPGTVRLQVEVEGYQPLTLSPILDSPQLLERIADLTPEQLEEWRIFEEIRTLLGELRLEFSLHR